ncbi:MULTISPECIES: aldehyde dehydrogenase family protein [unclassified Novosphingobium]|uniref:aldehyde dehydrogenase family protein n=1 Tax=unclassified Novosphingobium TaxID=2644732 RepID=UPI000ED48AC6|nr:MULTISPECIES: aldehyde dehydrogenase family protein [unclassified Novosphingobium]HCF24831.1 aldehyde dehydrogenase family protein [Novosphingobium sp.]HQV01957.1 aldehyde dehydrogenase family protein [Novosphingobium sp.]
MSDPLKSYIDGRWITPEQAVDIFEAINPATEEVCARVALCTPREADAAVQAARAAFAAWSQTPLDARIALVERLIAVFERRHDEMVRAITTEMGAPHDLSHNSQAECGPGHLRDTIRAARAMEWERPIGSGALLVHEAIGVCVLITPWNWPINQLAAKIGPALVAGCTMVVKPSEVAPLSAQLFAEFVEEAGFPAGVFNLVHGTGARIGPTLTAHPEVDMVSFTGSTAAGIQVSKAAADTVKRVSLELGGKSANVLFDVAGLETAVTRGVLHCFNNTGQSCNAPTRMLVEASAYDRAVEIARSVAAGVKLGDPAQPGSHLGPVVSKPQFDKIQRLIQVAIDEGAELVCGGPGRADGFERGYFVKPTIFASVNNQMTIAREEVFGPVLVMIPFADEAEAVRIANDSPYGLAGYVQSLDLERARRVARQIRAGSVHINGAGQDYCSPFGGYKQSGNGREWGEWGLHDFLELKVMNGYGA